MVEPPIPNKTIKRTLNRHLPDDEENNTIMFKYVMIELKGNWVGGRVVYMDDVWMVTRKQESTSLGSRK